METTQTSTSLNLIAHVLTSTLETGKNIVEIHLNNNEHRIYNNFSVNCFTGETLAHHRVLHKAAKNALDRRND